MSDRWVVEQAWLGDDVVGPVTLAAIGGRFTDVSLGATDGVPVLAGCAVPGFVNAHSHAFHRLLRGRTHAAGGDFWTWRDRMYEAAERLDPDLYEEVATAVFVEMVIAGFTTVGEFHYLHHGPGGQPYADPNAMGEALISAARRAGIRIALLDAGYFGGSVQDSHLDPVQARFSDGSVSAWIDRAGDLAKAHADDPDVVIGLAPHSVRAVPAEALAVLAARRPEGPLHIHVSEQPA
ncbi:MAG: amidohydrolase family protein, partial [Acidimicrobiia bacterium]